MTTTGSSSLVVTISADITDFTKQLNAMTKGVDTAAKQISLIGDVLKAAITDRVVEAGGSFLEMGATVESTAARMGRTFGALSDSVKASLDKMTATVPETTTDLENMAVHLDNVVQGMGVAPQQATNMSEALLQVAANAAAFAHVPITDALNALSAGLNGRGRELIQFGIGFNTAEVKARALSLGLLDQGNQLTETGTALASYSLIMDKAQRLNGAAAQSVNDADQQTAFLKRDVKALGDQIATSLLPALQEIVSIGRDVVGFFAGVPGPVYQATAAVLAFAAVAVPLALGIVKVTQAFNALRAGLSILTTGGSIVGFFASLTNPITLVLGATLALTAAVLALVAAYEALKGASPADTLAKDRSVLDNDPALAGFVAKNFAAPGKNQPTQTSTKTPFQELQENAAALSKLFDSALQHGQPIDQLIADVNQQFTTAGSLMDSLNGKFDLASLKNKELVQSAQDQLQTMKDIANVANAPTTAAANLILQGIANRPISASDVGAQAGVGAVNKYRTDLATRLGQSQLATPFNAQAEATIALRTGAQQQNNDLDERLAKLSQSIGGLPPGFDAAKIAAVQYGEAQQQEIEDQAIAFQTLKLKLNDLGINLGDLSQKMQGVVVTIANAAISFAESLAATAGGSGKDAGLGRGIGGLLGGIAGSVLGPAGSVVAAKVGSTVGAIAGGFLGGVFDKSTQSVTNNTTAMDTLTKTVNAVTASITNIPEWFKVGMYEFQAAPIVTPAAPPPGYQGPTPPGTPAPPSGPTPINGGAPNGNVIISGPVTVQLAPGSGKQQLDDFHEQLLKRRATGSFARAAFAGGLG